MAGPAEFALFVPSSAADPVAWGRAAERFGFSRLWLGNTRGDLALPELLLERTSLPVASGIVNIWRWDPVTVARAFHRLDARFAGRFLLGIGTGHPESNSDYAHPYRALVEYLDVLDAEGMPAGRRVLAALGPRVLELARERAAGAHPYLVTPLHTARARALLGPDRLLAPEHKAVIDADAERARASARPRVRNPYLGLGNYVNNLRRLGFTDGDLAAGGSDRLVDALVAHGDAEAVAAQLRAHLDAGADEVAVQLVVESDEQVPALLAALATARETDRWGAPGQPARS